MITEATVWSASKNTIYYQEDALVLDLLIARWAIDLVIVLNAYMDISSEEIAVPFHYHLTVKQMMETVTAPSVSSAISLIMENVYVNALFLTSLIASNTISIETVQYAKMDILYIKEDAIDGNLLILIAKSGWSLILLVSIVERGTIWSIINVFLFLINILALKLKIIWENLSSHGLPNSLTHHKQQRLSKNLKHLAHHQEPNAP